MTEAEWRACNDPRPMLDFLMTWDGVRARKARLFACACCWQAEALMDARCLAAVLVAELEADGLTEADEMVLAWQVTREIAEERWGSLGDDDVAGNAAILANVACEESGEQLSYAYEYLLNLTPRKHRRRCRAWVSQTFRCLCGPLPFRPMTIHPDWPRWNSGTIRKLSKTIYDGRELPSGRANSRRLRFLVDVLNDAKCTKAEVLARRGRQSGFLDNARLAVLADALEEAGCADPDILGHLRSPESHVRGCWPVDLILGKS